MEPVYSYNPRARIGQMTLRTTQSMMPSGRPTNGIFTIKGR